MNDISSVLHKIYGPLPKSYCMYFKAITVILFVLFCVSFVFMILSFTGLKPVGSPQYSVFIVLGYFLNYLTMRVLHTMCIKTLKDSE
jgi:hypothetical protein